MSVLHYSSSVEFKKNLREGRSFDKKKKKKEDKIEPFFKLDLQEG